MKFIRILLDIFNDDVGHFYILWPRHVLDLLDEILIVRRISKAEVINVVKGLKEIVIKLVKTGALALAVVV